MNLDQMSTLEFVETMNREDGKVIEAVHEVLPQVAEVIGWTTEALSRGGRIIYMGAGTSGRLGVLDAVECPPTFGVSPDVVVGLIAGGERAFVKAVEGAEDSTTLGTEDLKNLGLNDNDVVIGIAASGRTPYVIHALRYARSIGVKTAIIACNRNSEMSKEADVYENLMVDVMQSNLKLKTRAENIVMAATDCDRETARKTIDEAKGSVKLAITSILLNTSVEEAKTELEKANGHIRRTLK